MEAKDSPSAPPPLAALPLLANHSAAAVSDSKPADHPPRAAPPPPPLAPPPPPPRDALEERGGSTKNPSSSSPPMAPPPPPPPPPVMMVIQSPPQQQQQHSLNGSTPPPGSSGASASASALGGGGGSGGSVLSLGGGGGSGGGGLSGSGGPLLKRKRGRPRKYVEGTSPPVLIMGSGSPAPPVVSGISAISGLPTPPSSLGMALALAPLAAASSAAQQLPFAAAAAAPPSSEKKRGRPPGTGKKQQLAALGAWLAGSAGQGFTPHVITIAAGEDVATRIISFAQIGPRATCVLSANGAISNVTLRQPATSGGTVTYEGRFEILSLSGSFLLTEIGNTRSRTGGLSVSLAGPDGRVIGGSVAGLLVAASPVQVVVGSFLAESRKPAPQVQVRPSSGSTSEMISGLATAVNSPLSTTRPVLHGSNPINGNNNSSNDNTNANTNNNNTTSSNNDANANNSDSPVHHHHHHHHHHLGWPGGQDDHQQQNQSAGHGTDINISLPGS